ncbi:hypothetical protein CL629_00500 [bacterium]|nr:hypothetical protein [bacterium]|tara:strand:+ start:1569 stop:2099 length:531 start_codon:yes stop_codon:yes gene_type:complete
MSRFTKKILIDLSIAFVLLILLGAGIIFFRANLEEFSGKLSESRKELETRSSAIQRLAELKRVEEEFGKDYLNVLYNFIPKKDELINFSRELQALADSEGLAEFSSSFVGEGPASAQTLGFVRFSANISAKSETNILNFIKKLQEFRFLTKLESFSVSKGNQESKASIRGQIFFRG